MLPFEALLASLALWPLALALGRWLPLAGALLGLVALVPWPLPAGAALAYTAAVVRPPPEYAGGRLAVLATGCALVYILTVAGLPDPATADGGARRPLVLFRGACPRLAAGLLAFLALAPLPARIHHDRPWLVNAVNYAALVAALAGARRLLGGFLASDPAPAVQGGAYLAGALWAATTPPPRPAPHAVQGPGFYLAAALACLLGTLDDGAPPGPWAAGALTVAAALQARPAWRWARARTLPLDLSARYAHVRRVL